MIFWAGVGLVTLAVVTALLWPLLRGGHRTPSAAAYDVAVYRDQLDEVARNQAQGLIGAAEAEAAKAEIGRRLLDADARQRARDPAPRGIQRWPARATAVGLALLLPAAGLGLYLDLGRPGADAVPFTEREDVPKTRTAIMNAGQGGGGVADQPAALAEAEADLAAQLEESPDSVRGWLALGRARLQQGETQTALAAFAKARDLAPDSPRVAASYGEALVLANEGTVTPQAARLFREAAQQEPNNPQVAYYRALAEFQDGKARAALERWAKMVANSAPNAPWLDVVERHMAAAERQLDMEPGRTFASVAPEDAPAPGETAGDAPANGPTREQMAAAEDMDPAQRREMIEGMVAQLAARLESNPDDLDGWLRLARAYTVMESFDKARDALARAADLAPENVEVLLRYARAERRAAGNRPTDKSLDLARRVLDLDGENPEALWFVALHHAREGETEKARALFDKALAQFPESRQREELRRRAADLVGEG